MKRTFLSARTESEILCKCSSNNIIFIDANGFGQDEKYTFREIADDIFEQQQGFFVESSLSSTKSKALLSSEYKVDKRLQYWKDVLKHRRALLQKLNLITNKKPEQMLFNIDNREKETIKRLLDYADRINFPDHRIEQLFGNQGFEIIGMSKNVSVELVGPAGQGISSSKWVKSPILEKRLSAEFSKIKRFLKFVPNINNLEITGISIPVLRTGDIQSLYSISNETIDQSKQSAFICSHSLPSTTDEAPTLGLIINGFQCKINYPEFAPIKAKLFTCNPFERKLQTVLSLENNGRHVLSFSWTRVFYFSRNSTLFDTKDEEFVFDTHNFYLKPGEKYEVRILFQPRKVCIVKEKWLLRTRPRLFFRRPSAITLNLHGRCTPTEAYIHSLTMRHKQALSRSFDCMTTHKQILSIPNPCPLPSIFVLDERDIFNNRNKGFHCDSYADFELLKELFRQVNKDQNYHWNLKIDDLLHLICRETCLDERIQYFKELQQLLQSLRCEYTSRYHSDCKVRVAECKLTCIIYVRGIIGNAIEMWEQLILFLEAQHFKLALKKYNACTAIESNETLADMKNMNTHGFSPSEITFMKRLLDNQIKRNLARSKYFRDAIYMYTYTQLCNTAEDIVSVIESTVPF